MAIIEPITQLLHRDSLLIHSATVWHSRSLVHCSSAASQLQM